MFGWVSRLRDSAMIEQVGAAVRRKLLFAPILVSHAAVIVWFALTAAAPDAARHDSALTVFDVSSPSPAAPAPPAAPIVKSLKLVWSRPVVSMPSLPLSTIAMPISGGNSCDLVGTVQQALLASSETRAALAALPPSAHSVANAVMLWDGKWVDAGAPEAKATFLRVNAIISSVVRDASLSCRLEEQAGPRLIAIPGPPDTVLVLGSGRWRWNDVAPDDAEPVQLEVARENHSVPPADTILQAGI